MSNEVKAFKEHIKHLREKLKTLNEMQKVGGHNAARDAMIRIYSKDLVDHEVALRGLQIRARVEKAGHNYDEWWEWAKSLYDIALVALDRVDYSPHWRVTSKASNWKEQLYWDRPDEISCKEKVEQLVGYKMYDRNRGRGDVDQDMAHVK